MAACGTEEAERVQEAAADTCCQVASHEACRGALAQAGAVGYLAGLLGTNSDEVRWRAGKCMQGVH